MNKKQLKQQQYKNKYVVPHIHLKFGDQIYTVKLDGHVVDFKKFLAQLNELYCDALFMQKELYND